MLLIAIIILLYRMAMKLHKTRESIEPAKEVESWRVNIKIDVPLLIKRYVSEEVSSM